MARLEFTRKVKAAIVARANGNCEQCAAALKTGEGEVDHILPCALGGEATIANGRLICRVCHKAKTADDVRRIRQSDRQRDKHNGVVRPAGKMKGPRFPAPAKEPRQSSKATLQRRPLYVKPDAARQQETQR